MRKNCRDDPDPLLVLTADLRVRVANPAFYHTFQVRPAETEGQLIYQLDHGQWDIPALRTLLEELLPHNTVFNDYEVTQTFERIGARTMLLNARRLDAVQLILLAMEDITARKQTERRLQEEIAERQRLERDAQRVAHFALLGRLAGGVSHELRNPLAVIVLHVDLLEEELRQPSPDSATEIALALTEIKAHLARVDDLVEDYLSLVRGSTLQQTPMELSLLVTQCAHEILPALAAHGITLRLDAVDQLGMVALHPHSFRRVLVNLVHNAVDAMPQGGTLTLQGRRQAATVSLAVQDTGSGIPRSTSPRFLSRCIPRNREARGWDSISCRRWWPRMAARWPCRVRWALAPPLRSRCPWLAMRANGLIRRRSRSPETTAPLASVTAE